MLLIQVDNLIIPPPMEVDDYLRQLEESGLASEDQEALDRMRSMEKSADTPEPQEGGVPPPLQHIFKKHFRQGRFLIATEAQAAAARVIRDLGFAAFVNAPAAFVSLVEVREVDPMAVMQASALTEWFAEVETPVGKVFGLHYPSSWINLPAPVEDDSEHAVTAILKRIMLNSAPLAPTDRHFPEAHPEMRWMTPHTQLRIDFLDQLSITDSSEALTLANSVTEQNLRIRRIAGGDLKLAEACRPLFPEFIPA